MVVSVAARHAFDSAFSARGMSGGGGARHINTVASDWVTPSRLDELSQQMGTDRGMYTSVTGPKRPKMRRSIPRLVNLLKFRTSRLTRSPLLRHREMA